MPTYPEVLESLAMCPEEGKGIEMHISFNSQTLKFPEEGLSVRYVRFIILEQESQYYQLAKVKSSVSSESLVAQEDPQAGEIGAMPSKVDKLGAGALLVVELKGQLLQPRTHHSYERSDVIKPHGDQVELHQVLQAKQGRPHSTVRVVENRNLVVDDKVELPQLGTSVHHQLHVLLDLSPLAGVPPLLVAASSCRFAGTISNHLSSHILELGRFRHKANVGLAKVVSVGGVGKFLQAGVHIISMLWQVFQDLQAIHHGIEPLAKRLQAWHVQEKKGDKFPQHVAASNVEDL